MVCWIFVWKLRWGSMAENAESPAKTWHAWDLFLGGPKNELAQCWVRTSKQGIQDQRGRGYTLEHSLTDLVLENHYQLCSFDWFILEHLNETNIYQHVSAYISIIYHMYISVPAKHGGFLTYVRLLLAICIMQHKMAVLCRCLCLVVWPLGTRVLYLMRFVNFVILLHVHTKTTWWCPPKLYI